MTYPAVVSPSHPLHFIYLSNLSLSLARACFPTQWQFFSFRLPTCSHTHTLTLTEQCIPYTGELCEPIGYTSNTSVYFRRQRRDSVETLELDLKVILHLVQDEPSHGCELVAKQLLCAGALPTCRDNGE